MDIAATAAAEQTQEHQKQVEINFMVLYLLYMYFLLCCCSTIDAAILLLFLFFITFFFSFFVLFYFHLSFQDISTFRSINFDYGCFVWLFLCRRFLFIYFFM